jgi:Haem-binding uptake, Tiki superfamily, ChaN
MASIANLRSRRSAGQRYALASVEREIRMHDSNARRKYLRDFADAFRSYELILGEAAVQQTLCSADIALIADYHALSGAQRCAASLLEARALPGDRPLVLGVETIFSRDQHILDEWWRREISAEEFRARIRFDSEWGYDWVPFYELLVTAREHAEAIYGLDCMPREDLRKIGARDRHAAAKIAEIRERHPNAAILVLFGESHLAPQHLPARLRELLPAERLLTILQNVDSLYWHITGEQTDRIPAVRVNSETICLFNATPLEKYESYRLFLDRWQREDSTGPDLTPTLYNLINSLASVLGVERYSSYNHTQPRFLVDLLPEIYGSSSLGLLRRRLERRNLPESEIDSRIKQLEETGCVYWPEVNALSVQEFKMHSASEAAARFLYAACQGLPHTRSSPGEDKADNFYSAVFEHALADFGGRILDPARLILRDADLQSMYALTREELERVTQLPFARAIQMVDLALWHRDLEPTLTTPESFKKALADEIPALPESDFLARQLGFLLGSDLYDAYLDGLLQPAAIRRLMLAPLASPGAAPQNYFELARKLRRLHRKSRSASTGK